MKLRKLCFKLCFIKNDTAWFTNKEPFTSQWGDDWDDAPYEHNAGEPYEDNGELYMVKFHGDFETPYSRYSVKQINNGAIAWLWSSTANKGINAGASVEEFISYIEGCGGIVFLPRSRSDES